MTRKAVVSFGLAITCVVAAFAQAAKEMPLSELMPSADYAINGEVVDEQGMRLDRVRLTISESRLRGPKPVKEEAERKEEINGAFNVTAKSAHAVTLSFSREGYYSERLDFVPPRDYKRTDVVRAQKLRVVLEKHGPLIGLRREVSKLSYSIAGSHRIWDLAKGPDTKVADVRDAAAMPDRCIYLLPELDGDKPAIQMLRLGPGERSAPKGFRLVLKGDGGIHPVETVAAAQQKQYRKMKLAPEKGYQGEWTWDAEAIRQYFSSDSDAKPHAFFYVRIGDRYGKGHLSLDLASPDEVSVRLILRMRKDVGRELETSD